MKRVLTIVAGLVAALGATLASSPVASAYNGYDATATNVSYASNSCFTSRITISGFDGEDHDVEVQGPTGRSVDSFGSDGDPSEIFTPLLCNGLEATGRYSVSVDGIEVTSFQVVRPVFVTRVVHPDARNAQVRSRLTLNGRPLANRLIGVEYLRDARWSQVGGRRTNLNGNATMACSQRGMTCSGLYRFTYGGVASSAPFQLPTRR